MNNMNTDTRNLSIRGSRVWHLIFLFAAMMLTLTVGTACGGPKIMSYGSASNGKDIFVEKGETFSVSMLVNTKTDAKWHIVEFDKNIIEPMGPPRYMVRIPNGGLPRIASYDFMFRGATPGSTTLKLVQTLPDQKDPIETFEATIVVE